MTTSDPPESSDRKYNVLAQEAIDYRIVGSRHWSDLNGRERYDPEQAPAAEVWLGLDEGERILLVEWYHRDARIPLPRSARTLHATMHVVVENQLALNDDPVVRALARLMKEGLSRHDAVHAIGSVVAETIYDRLKQQGPPDAANARYYAAIERLTAATWRALGGD